MNIGEPKRQKYYYSIFMEALEKPLGSEKTRLKSNVSNSQIIVQIVDIFFYQISTLK